MSMKMIHLFNLKLCEYKKRYKMNKLNEQDYNNCQAQLFIFKN